MAVIPAQPVEQLTEALAKWDGRGPSHDDTLSKPVSACRSASSTP
jgi:hypothetical protein